MNKWLLRFAYVLQQGRNGAMQYARMTGVGEMSNYGRSASPGASPATMLPTGGEIDDVLWAKVAHGQPVLLRREGMPAAVVIDIESWSEVEALAETGE